MADILLNKLQDPFLRMDGTRLKSPSEWPIHRANLLKSLIDLEYGGMPPAPSTVRVEPVNETARGGEGNVPRVNVYRIHCGTSEHPLSFILYMYVPKSSGKLPVVLTGDGCYMSMSNEVIYEINRRGMIAARFDRLEFATDRFDSKRDHALYKVYPGMTFSALAAWAWGYHRALDAIEQIDYCDASHVAITGHSRGGKTVLLAGATDERFFLVNPNDSGAGGAGCYRYHMQPDIVPPGADRRSETIQDTLRMIPYWFGPGMQAYYDHEDQLPFDQHMLKACVAPRLLLQTEGMDDIWANPKGSYQTLLAAKEVYRWLGAEDRIAAYYREGGHHHGFAEYVQLLDFMEAAMKGYRADPHYYEHPYPDMENIFDWSIPGCP